MSINFDNYNNIVSMFFEKSKEMKDKPYLWKKNNNKFESLSWEDIELSVKSVARSLIDLGVLKGDRVIILSENRPYWLMSDLAIMNAGGISVPIFTTYSSNDYKYILSRLKLKLKLKYLILKFSLEPIIRRGICSYKSSLIIQFLFYLALF